MYVLSVVNGGRPAGQPAVCSDREGARALPLAGGGTGGPSLRRPLSPVLPSASIAAAQCPAARLAAMDLGLIERTVARLHDEEPTFDWVGVYLLEANTLIEEAVAAIAAGA